MASETLRLAPIEKPPGLFMRFVYWMTRRQFGKVITPVKVIYARKPELAWTTRQIVRTEEKLTLDPSLIYLVKVHISRMNGCAFCEDIALAFAVQSKIGRERFAQLADFHTSDAFTAAERAALTLVEEVTRDRRVSDATWSAVREHFNETQIVELLWVNATENYYNLMNAPLGIESDRLAGS